MSAVLSPCGTYRYLLHRIFGDVAEGPSCLFVMLNPSTADAMLDDPTIRRCMGFARREGCKRMTVVNLFALRATDPDELMRHADPVGPDNYAVVERELRYHLTTGIIIAAWGANWLAAKGQQGIQRALRDGGAAKCLGKTKDGAPRHPLYLKSSQPLEPWP